MNYVFLSYSHKDELWKDRLKPHLEMLEKCDRLKYWDDRKIDTGATWYPEIQDAMEQATVAILLISAHYLSSDFCLKEEIPFLLERRAKQGVLIIPILIRPCHWKAIDWLQAMQMIPRDGKSVAIDYKDDYDTIFTNVVEQIDNYQLPSLPAAKKPAAQAFRWRLPKLKEKTKIKVPPKSPIDIGRLPVTGAELFGRKKELQILDDAWESGDMNVISFVAWGGVGKSTLVNKWIERMAADNYRSAKRVYAWSFYSQGTGERVTSADQFINHALKFFGDPDPTQGSPWDKGKRLANLIRADKTLLILDGLEPLQSDLRFEYGKIKDPALSVLVSELAKANPGLCVITSRVEIAEMLRYPSSVRQVDLEQISDEAGRALLRVRGVRGSDAELEGVTRAFGNHALAINLLAEYLHTIPEHPAQAAHQIPDLDMPEKEGKYPRRVMEAFAAQFGEGAELELLCVLGLFDRPAAKAAIDAVIHGEPIKGLTKYLSQLSESDWLRLLQKLQDLKLIAHESKHRPDIVDCHPLVREHFGSKLREKSQSAWRSAHSRLYEYYKNLPKKELPDTLEEMEPLFAAVAHGCQAGLCNEALVDVYKDRIQRGKEYHSTKKLGAFGYQISAMSNFYKRIWAVFIPELDESHKGYVLGETGYSLWALGRIAESVQSYKKDLKFRINEKNWKSSSIILSNLSSICQICGDLKNAEKYAHQGIELSDRCDEIFWQVSTRSDLAAVFFQKGFLLKAEEIFIEAENLQKIKQPHRPFLYSVNGFHFCDLLLSQGKFREVLKRAKYTIKSAKKRGAILDIGNDKISLGRVSRFLALSKGNEYLKKSIEFLCDGVNDLKKSSQQQDIPYGIIARAQVYRILGDFSKAWDDLEEAQELAERGSMKLHLVDYHLEASRLLISEFGFRNADKPKEFNQDEMLARLKMHVEQAAELVQQTGYHRRDPEVELGYAGLFFAQRDHTKAWEHLGKAKALLDKMGVRCWDFEVRRLEQVIGCAPS